MYLNLTKNVEGSANINKNQYENVYLAAVNNYYTYMLLKYNHPNTARVRDKQLIYIRIQGSYVYILSANVDTHIYSLTATSREKDCVRKNDASQLQVQKQHHNS